MLTEPHSFSQVMKQSATLLILRKYAQSTFGGLDMQDRHTTSTDNVVKWKNIPNVKAVKLIHVADLKCRLRTFMAHSLFSIWEHCERPQNDKIKAAECCQHGTQTERYHLRCRQHELLTKLLHTPTSNASFGSRRSNFRPCNFHAWARSYSPWW